MWKTLVAGLTGLMLAAPLWAQESTEEETGANELSMGEVVSEDRVAGTIYSDEVFDDWERRCTTNPEGEDPCHLYQLLLDEGGQATAEINILALPEGLQAAAGVTVIVPLQTLLTQQLTVAIDSHPAKRYPFKFCTQAGCVAQIGLTADEVANFKRGAEATITIVPAGAPDQKVGLALSLTGFTSGYDSLSATNLN